MTTSLSSNLSSVAIYLKCSNGFGNKVFDLISAVYLKNKYKIDVYYAIGKSEYDVATLNNDKSTDTFFGNIFYQSYKKIKYIYMNKYNRLKETLPIEEKWIDSLDDLPNTITTNIRFRGLYRFGYLMYSSFSDDDKKLFEINPKVLNEEIYNKYINKLAGNYACVHIRYGDKLCFGLEDFKSSKYTPYMLPIYTPQYYIDQINELLKKDLGEILIITDSVGIIGKYIMEHIFNNPRVVLFDSHYIDSFYLMTKSKYIILSHSTFSFAAAYFNPTAICYLLKKYMVDVKKDYIFEDDAISPNWIIIDNKEYLLNFNQELLKKMVDDYAECNKYIGKQIAGKRDYRSHSDPNFGKNDNIVDIGEKKIKNQRLDEFITNGPVTIDDTKIGSKLTIYGTLDFTNLTVAGVTKLYGTVYGKKGRFNKLNVYGPLYIDKGVFNRLALYGGPLDANEIDIADNALIVGPIYISNGNINSVEILSEYARFDKCIINTLDISNWNNNAKKIIIDGTVIKKIIIRGTSINIQASLNSVVDKIINGNVVIDKDL